MYGIHYKTVHLFRTEVLIKKQVANRTSVHVIFLKVRHKCADRFILTTGSLIIQPDIFPIYNPISSFNCRIDNASRPDGSLSGNSTTTGRTGRQVPSFSFYRAVYRDVRSHPHLNATCPGTPLSRWSFPSEISQAIPYIPQIISFYRSRSKTR